MYYESGLEVIDTSLRNWLKVHVLILRPVSLKQKKLKRFIDAYPLLGTGGGGKIKKQNCLLKHLKINFVLWVRAGSHRY